MAFDFEKHFSELQADMVSVCLEYCEKKCEQIYIHVICEHDSIFPNFFFLINGIIRKKHKLSDEVSVSMLRQKEALSIITKDTVELIKLCKENKKPVPTEFKLIYNAQTGSLKADYNYNTISSEEKSIQEVSEVWFIEESKKCE